MKHISAILLLSVIFGYGATAQLPGEVSSIGSLRQIKSGQIGPQVKIDTLIGPNTYGLGAVSELQGEILVMAGRKYASVVRNGNIELTEGSDLSATLFVYADVAQWDTTEVTITSGIEEFLSNRFGEIAAGMPFILIGKHKALDYHIINFDPNSTDFANHKKGSVSETLYEPSVTILGFYATNAQGVYTHHDSRLHMHAIPDDRRVVGHVDRVEPGNEPVKLLLPKR